MSKKLYLILLSSCFSLFVFSQNADKENEFLINIKSLEKEIEESVSFRQKLEDKLEEKKLEYYHYKIATYGLPEHTSSEQIVHHKAMVLNYSEKHEQAIWVVHLVTKDVLYGNVSRTNDFRKDPLVKTGSANKDDYWYSGYDRGHLAPSADFRWSKTALSESYFYSNMSPQKPELNRESWAKLEDKIRTWAIDNDELLIVTGGVLKDGLPFIKGTSKVSVPEYFYKVVADYTNPGIKGIAFIMPNSKCEKDIFDYAVSIDSVQNLTGINFFASLPEDIQNTIEQSFNLSEWEHQDSEVIEDTQPLPSQKGQYNTTESKSHIGEKCTVCGTVVSAKYAFSKKGRPTFINLDKKFPNQVFSVTIWGNEHINFSYDPEVELPGKKVCFTSKLAEYKGTPQMIITNEKQITFLDDESESE